MMRRVSLHGEDFTVEEAASEARWNFWGRATAGAWEPGTFEAIDRLCWPGSTFVDIGAWIGPFSLYASRRCATVYAVEPDLAAAEQLVRNALHNDIRNIVLDPCAISDQTGTATLGNRSQWGDSTSSLLFPEQPHPVRTLRFEDWWRSRSIRDCALIKIDTEGGEGRILPDAWAFLRQLHVPIHLSLHAWVPDDQQARVVEALAGWHEPWDGASTVKLLLP